MLTTATIARSLKLNYNDNTDIGYIYKIQLGIVFIVVLYAKRCFDVVCIDRCWLKNPTFRLKEVGLWRN
jgi:hypothetical protein